MVARTATGGADRRTRVVLFASCAVYVATTLTVMSGVPAPLVPLAVQTALVGASLGLCGGVLTRAPRSRTLGLRLLVAGAAWPLNLFAATGLPFGAFVSWVASGALWTLLGFAVLSYPQELRRTRAEQIFLVLLTVDLTLVNALLAAVESPRALGFAPSMWWPAIPAPAPVAAVVTVAYGVLTTALGVGAVVIAVARLRRASGVDRLVLLPALAGITVSALLAAAASGGQTFVLLPDPWIPLVSLQGWGLLAVPLAALAGAGRARLLRVAVADSIARIARPAKASFVQKALREVLHDERCRVLLWLPERAALVDVEGVTTAPSGYSEPLATGSGEPLAVIEMDEGLRFHPALVRTALATATIALENARLLLEVQQRLEEVEASRIRIMEAVLDERARVGRDLHDGAQQRLLGVAMRLEAARAVAADDRTRSTVEGAKQQVLELADDIRDLARGLHPAELRASGLLAALETVADTAPIPVALDLPSERYHPGVEAAAYFVACEAITNAAKHAGGVGVDIRARSEQNAFVIEVRDRGPGGAIVGSAGGLLGMRDRLTTLGGSLDVESLEGSGTLVVGRIPLPR